MALIVCLIALSRIFGYAVESRELEVFGRAIGFAPLPVPFREVDGFENYVVRSKIVVNLKDGSSDKFTVDYGLKEQLKGPHRYKIVLFYLFGWGPRLPYRLVEPVFQYIFCRGYHDHIWGANVASATITYYSKRNGTEMGRLTYHCHD